MRARFRRGVKAEAENCTPELDLAPGTTELVTLTATGLTGALALLLDLDLKTVKLGNSHLAGCGGEVVFWVCLGSGVRERVQCLGHRKEERGAEEGKTRSDDPEAVGRKLYPVHGVIRLVNLLSGRGRKRGAERARRAGGKAILQ